MVETRSPAISARWWRRLDDGRIECNLCPRECKLSENQRGFCFVRKCEGDSLVLTTYGRSSGFCIDPIEKKPLHHFYPGSSVLSFGTAGCNLGCKFCQNWDISKSRNTDKLCEDASPSAIAHAAVERGCKSVAFTYNDPVIFAEYAIDTADACRALGVRTVAVTAGYMNREPRVEFYAKMDAANVDLKAFSEKFYFELTGGHLQPVKETIEHIARETKTWLEITTLLIPGYNDSEREIEELSCWILERLGAHIPLHFSAFHPAYKMTNVVPTPPGVLMRAREIARRVGLWHVYAGNVHNVEGDTTFCSGCGKALIARDFYELLRYELTPDGRCSGCDKTLSGVFDERPSDFGRRRIAVSFGKGEPC